MAIAALEVITVSGQQLLASALALAQEHGCSVYDAMKIAAALDLERCWRPRMKS